MNAGAKMFRSLMLAGVLVLVGAGAAHAAANPATCINDVDCIATPTCGGDVCDYNAGTICNPAGGATKGHDGWCDPSHGDADCKCKALGAKCVGVYCTFTKPSDAPASGAAGASGGTAGAGTAGAGTAGAGTAGASGGTAGASGTAGKAPAPSSGGCSVASSTSGGFAALVGVALIAGRLVRRRRRA